MVSSSSRAMPRDEMAGLLRGFAHRGPDDQGWLSLERGGALRRARDPEDVHAHVVLLHRRLSILDLSECGWQPMSSPDGRLHIVYNGEIYNFVELRRELQGLGHAFHSSSDTEVLLAAYAQWGAAALERLVGMFGLAILDLEDRSLFLARDCFGIKPLYYTAGPDGFAFASEIRTLLASTGMPRAANPQRVYDYLRLGLTEHGSETMTAGVHQLPAAHWMRVRLDEPTRWPEPVRYWSVPLDERTDLSFAQAAEQLRALVLDSVRLHLRSDVPVGAALSGGVDSSAVVAAIHHLQPHAELHTFTYVADDPAVSDEPWADRMIGRFPVRAHKVRPSADEMVRDLDHLIGVQEEPFASTSMYAQHRVFRLAHEAGIPVTLDGQGADELFGGYYAFRSARLASIARRRQWRKAARFASASAALPGSGMGKLLLRTGGLLIPPGLQAMALGLVRQPLAPSWLNAGWFEDRGVHFRPHWRARGKNVLKERMHRFLTEIHLPALLRFEDRNSMAFSIESRVPFLTPQIAAFAYSLPEEYLVTAEGTTKAVLREAMRGLVPDAILDRRDKIAFNTPEKQWLGALRPWVESVIASEAAREIPVFQNGLLRREWDRVLAGERAFDGRVWRWLNLIRWTELNDIRFN